MSYEVFSTRAADRDILKAADYIEFVLHNPQAADSLLDEVDIKFNSLSENPERYAVVSDPVLKSWQIRFIQVRNYLAFYVISECERRVYVVRFLYGRRDWVSILRSTLIDVPSITELL
jgi:plasmid stabilization system protein ParE